MDYKHQRSLRRISAFVIIAAFGVIFGILFASRMNWTDVSIADEEQTTSQPANYVFQDYESPFVAVAENIKPAVVSISTESRAIIGSPFELFDFGPFKDFFRQHDRPQEQKTRSAGSGIIISEKGYILTNNHLVENADNITVRLASDEEYEAEVIGADPITDVALIKIAVKLKPEQVARLGNSDEIKIGQWAIAIGNPFGLDWTVTVGVISAIGRGGLNIAGRGPDIQNFIQTDASINFGNSGGPLVNIHGEVIGINTAINTEGQGIGFAIPVNMAKEVADQLKESGRVSHGYLGMVPVELTAAKKEALGLDPDVRGVFVDMVEEDNPADEGGLEPSDVIVEFEGVKITNVIQFRSLVASKRAGDKVEAVVVRDGRKKRLAFILGDRAEILSATYPVERRSDVWLGIHIESLKGQQARQWNITEVEGVLVVEIDQDSPAEGVLQGGDVIIEIDKCPVKSVKDFNNIATDLKDRKKSILFRISRNGRKTFEVIKPE
ncbi:MAG: trypsin-like peptidase domain-containing protein [candidate division Zixibacteria bacterium]|nr:trypsin-like peptidase domain-containing protein [Candidatus Tariuqbacter arcticus]